MDLDRRTLLHIARRRWWIVVLLMVLAGAAAYVTAKRETPMYSASATMLVSPGQAYSGGLDYNSMRVTEYLIETYPELIASSDMSRRVAGRLGLEEIPGHISASAVEGSQLVKVTVTDTDPKRAAQVANTVVSEFQVYMSESAQQRANTARSMLDTQIEAIDQRLDEIDARLAELAPAASKNDGQALLEIDSLTQERGALTTSKVDLTTNALTIGAQTVAASPSVEPAVSAEVPTEPFSPRPVRSTLLGLAAGLWLGLGLIAVLEFLDNTVKPEHNFQELIGAPLLASVPALKRLTPGGDQLYVRTHPHSTATEAQRLLRTNLEFASATRKIGAVTITSPNPGEGKSTTAANLGVVLAQSGLQTVVIDADMRKPTQHRIFGMPNDEGLTTLLMRPELGWRAVGKEAALPGLTVIPCGPLPPNPAELLSTARFKALLKEITAETDIVIVDSPPVLAASDALAIAAQTDGVLMVCHSDHTRRDALRHAAEGVHQGGIRLIGAVMNRQKRQHGASYYGEYYGAYYGDQPAAGD